MKTNLLCLIMIASLPLLSQNNPPRFQWVRTLGGIAADTGNAVCVDAQQNVYATGFFKGTVDIDPCLGVINCTSLGDDDMYVLKLDGGGNTVWAKHIGGPKNQSGVKIATDKLGNVLVVGIFQGTVDFDPGIGMHSLSCVGDTDMFILKLNNNGDFIWCKHIGGYGGDMPWSITEDINTDIIITGYFEQTVDFDPDTGISQLTSHGLTDIFVLKLDSNGAFKWVRNMGGTANERGFSLTTDSKANIAITGPFKGKIDIDPGPGVTEFKSAGDNDIYIAMLSDSGWLMWANHVGGKFSDKTYAIVTDKYDNFVVGGAFQDTVNFQPFTSNFIFHDNGGKDYGDAFIMKVDNSGNVLWVVTYGGHKDDYCHSLALDSDGNVYGTGIFVDQVDFNTGNGVYTLNSVYGRDAYIQKIDSSGNWLWAVQLGGSKNDFGFSIMIDKANSIYTVGSFDGTTDFDTDSTFYKVTTAGEYDAYIHKLSQCMPTFSAISAVACDQYLWNGQLYTQSGTYTFHGLNSTGCDSLCTLALTIQNVNDSVYTINNMLYAMQANAVYQWVDCINGHVPLNGQTAQSYSPVGVGSYAVVVSLNGCTDTSDCITFIPAYLHHQESQRALMVYPNPSTNQFTVKTSGSHILSITVYDLQMKKMLSMKVTDGVSSMPLNIDSLDDGIYYLRVVCTNTTELIKIAKKQ